MRDKHQKALVPGGEKLFPARLPHMGGKFSRPLPAILHPVREEPEQARQKAEAAMTTARIQKNLYFTRRMLL